MHAKKKMEVNTLFQTLTYQSLLPLGYLLCVTYCVIDQNLHI